MDEAVEWLALQTPVAKARLFYARTIVHRVEGEATKSTNRFLREVARTGAIPVDWFETLAWPVAINRHDRVALRAITSSDLLQFEVVERRSADSEHASRLEACEGAHLLAEWLGDSHVGIADIAAERAA
jgi:hypothetical protein